MKLLRGTLAFLLLSACTSSPTSPTPKIGLKVGAGPSLEASLSFERETSEARSGKDTVGRWAKASRAGGPRLTGIMAPPTATDFSVSLVTATGFTVNRGVGFPAPADRWSVLVVDTVTGAVAWQSIAVSGASVAVTGLTTGRGYRVYVAWAQFSTSASLTGNTFLGVTTPA